MSREAATPFDESHADMLILSHPPLPARPRPGPSGWLRGVQIALVCALLIWGGIGLALGQTSEYQVKAAFVYKFCSYIEWPGQAFDKPDSPIVIGVSGLDAVAEELLQITSGHAVNGRPIVIRKTRRGEPLTGLHILYVTRAENSHMAEAIAAAKGQAMLVVTETEAPPPADSMINFVMINDKIRFDIALQPAEQSNLKISARLLAVARKVFARPS